MRSPLNVFCFKDAILPSASFSLPELGSGKPDTGGGATGPTRRGPHFSGQGPTRGRRLDFSSLLGAPPLKFGWNVMTR
jgi:hypothetical protein